MEKQRRDQGQQHRAHHHQGGVPAGKAGDEVLDAGFLLGGVFHQFQDPGHGALGVGALGADLQQAREVDAAGDHLLAHGFVHGQALAGEGGGVDAAAALEDNAVQGDLLAGLDQDRLAHGDFLRIHLLLLSVPQDVGVVGADIHEGGDGLAAAAYGDGLEELADLIKEHDRRGFGVLPDGESAQGGDRHQELFIKDLAVGDVAQSRPEHVPADDQIGNDEGQGLPKPLCGQQRRHEGEQRCREDPVEGFLLPSRHIRFISG